MLPNTNHYLRPNDPELEERKKIEQEKCSQAENAAWAARPKVYRLIKTTRMDESHHHGKMVQKALIPGRPSIQMKSTYLENIKSMQTDYQPNPLQKKRQIDQRPDTRFFALGCQGDKNTSAQLQVAAFMNKIAALSVKDLPDFILLLGDNFYDFGVEASNSELFKHHFDDVYSHPDFIHLRKMPVFAILGNHDENRHRMAFLEPENGIARGIHQVARTYYPKSDKQTTKDLQNLYRSHTDDNDIIELDLNSLPAWNMPSRFYALICGNTQIFCINSNTYVSDYLKLYAGDLNPYNQAGWVAKELVKARNEGRKIMLALHHPLTTPGKRAFNSDWDLYLSAEEKNSENFKKLFGHLDSMPSYNQLMCETLKHQQLVFDAVFTAHDHDMYYFNNKTTHPDYPLCQITSGGGGGPLQKREAFDDQASMGCFIKRHGFTDVNSPANGPVHFYLHTLPKSENDPEFFLHFTNENCHPIRIYPEKIDSVEIESIKQLHAVVKHAIDAYLAFIAPRQREVSGNFLQINPWGGNTKHGHSGIERAHKVWAYISNNMADNYQTTVEKIYMLSRWDTAYTKPSEHSFITILNDKIAEKYGDGVTIEALYERIPSPPTSHHHNYKTGKNA